MMTTRNFTELFKDGKVVGRILPGEVKPEDLIEGATIGSTLVIQDGGELVTFKPGQIIPIKEKPKPKRRRKTSAKGE